MVALGKLEAGLKFELLGWGPDETRCQGSETRGDSADSTGVMGLRQKQLGPCLQILAPCTCVSQVARVTWFPVYLRWGKSLEGSRACRSVDGTGVEAQGASVRVISYE